VDQSPSHRVGACRWSLPECTAEVNVARFSREHISVDMPYSAGAVKGISGELAVANVAEMGLDSRLARRSVCTEPSFVTTRFGILDFSEILREWETYSVTAEMLIK
jgi:hypothetical protein